ncbi:MAG: hypothetical protein ABMA00_20975 [Gemmatimonas sp.]
MRACSAVRWGSLFLGLGAMTAACRPKTTTASDAVLQFYTVRDALGGSGAPSAKELAALRPYIADTLARGLTLADSLRQADIARAPDEKPRFVEGDLFSSMFEGPTAHRVMPPLATVPVLVPVEFTNDSQRPVVRWTDTAVVIWHDGHWQVQDVRYGGTWAFGNKGSLLRALFSTP